MVGRTHHQQVQIFIIEQSFKRVIRFADGDAMLDGIGQAGRGRIDISDDIEIRPGRGKYPRQIAQSIAQSDNANPHRDSVSRYSSRQSLDGLVRSSVNDFQD